MPAAAAAGASQMHSVAEDSSSGLGRTEISAWLATMAASVAMMNMGQKRPLPPGREEKKVLDTCRRRYICLRVRQARCLPTCEHLRLVLSESGAAQSSAWQSEAAYAGIKGRICLAHQFGVLREPRGLSQINHCKRRILRGVDGAQRTIDKTSM